MEKYVNADIAYKKLQELLYETALNNSDEYGFISDVYVDIAENRLATWIDLIPAANVQKEE